LNKILYKRIGIALIRGIQRSKKNPVKWAIERPSTHTHLSNLPCSFSNGILYLHQQRHLVYNQDIMKRN